MKARWLASIVCFGCLAAPAALAGENAPAAPRPGATALSGKHHRARHHRAPKPKPKKEQPKPSPKT